MAVSLITVPVYNSKAYPNKVIAHKKDRNWICDWILQMLPIG